PSALASLGVGAFALGPAFLSDIRPLTYWCDPNHALPGFACADLTGKTVMDIALAGVPLESSGIGTAPIESSDLADTPIESSPIESSLLQGTLLESTPLSQVDLSVSPLGAIHLAAILPAGAPMRQV